MTTRKPTDGERYDASQCKPVYKVVRVEEGKLKSLWVKGTEDSPTICQNLGGEEFFGVAITYRREALSSDGRYGIFCCTTLKEAEIQMIANGHHLYCKIYEAYPVGREIFNDTGYGGNGTVLFPAVILGKKALVSGMGGG